MPGKVIVVPGFMGSTLGRVGDDSTRGHVWYERTRLLTGAYKLLQLAPNGTDPGPLAGGVRLERKLQPVQLGPWGAVIGELQRQGWEAELWPYDWRLDIRTTAQKLAAFLADVAVISPFYVLAYSMGGLIARLAYGRYLNLASGTRWVRTLYVCVPQFGTHEAAQYLARPVQSIDMLGLYAPGLAGYLPTVLNSVFVGALNGKTRGIVATWPAIYQCLPDITADWITTRPLDPKLYEVSTYLADNPHVDPNWLNAGLATRTELNATLSATRPAERSVVANGVLTSDALQNPADVATEDGYRNIDGDGTVTPLRAGLPGVVEALTLAPGKHCDVPADGRLLSRLTSLLEDADVEPSNAIVVEPPPPSRLIDRGVIVIPPKGAPAEVRRGDP